MQLLENLSSLIQPHAERLGQQLGYHGGNISHQLECIRRELEASNQNPSLDQSLQRIYYPVPVGTSRVPETGVRTGQLKVIEYITADTATGWTLFTNSGIPIFNPAFGVSTNLMFPVYAGEFLNITATTAFNLTIIARRVLPQSDPGTAHMGYQKNDYDRAPISLHEDRNTDPRTAIPYEHGTSVQ